MAKKEGEFQLNLRKRIEREFPGSMVWKNDSSQIQGLPDLMILYENKWAALECKRSKNEKHQPNQDYYVAKMNEMSYSAFVYPENEEDVLDGLHKTFGV